MRRKKTSDDSEHFSDETLINLTPLIDVVFVVLIAFILIAPLLETDHVNLAPSSVSSEKNISNKSPITIHVKEDDSILINNRLVTLSELTYLLKEKKRLNPDQTPQLFHDKKACFGTYQSIKNSIEAAGFDQMDVILKPD